MKKINLKLGIYFRITSILWGKKDTFCFYLYVSPENYYKPSNPYPQLYFLCLSWMLLVFNLQRIFLVCSHLNCWLSFIQKVESYCLSQKSPMFTANLEKQHLNLQLHSSAINCNLYICILISYIIAICIQICVISLFKYQWWYCCLSWPRHTGKRHF